MSNQMSTSRALFTCLGGIGLILLMGWGLYYEIRESIEERKLAAMPTRTLAPSPIPTPTPLPTPTEIVPKVVIKYDDGTKEELQNWSFKYTFGSRGDRAPRSGDVYHVEEKLSPDLHIQIVSDSGTITKAVIIPGDELKSISYNFSAGERYPEIVILTKSGEEYVSALDQIHIPDPFLSDAKYVFGKLLHLVGKVKAGDQLQWLSLDLFNWYSNQGRRIKEIVYP